jgi:peptide/nickel transport system substrate-binding protein
VISTQDVDSLMGSEATGMLMTSSLGYQHLDVNLGNDGPGNPPKQIDTPLAQEPLVRQALSMAIDREALVDSVFGGWFEPTCSPIPEVSGLSSDASDECPEHDPEGAVALLEEAGVEVPYEVELRIPNFPDNLRLGQALQAMVAEGGFDLGVAPVEYSTLNADSIQGNYDLEQQSWSGRLDPNGNMYNFLTTDGGYNRTGYSNRQVDQLLADATATYDTQERIALYGQAMQIVHEDNPLIFLYRIRNLTGYSADVAGIEAYVDGVFDVSRAAFLE